MQKCNLVGGSNYLFLVDGKYEPLCLQHSFLFTRHHNLVLVHGMRWNSNLNSGPLHQLMDRLAVRSTDERMVDFGNGQTLERQLCLTNNTMIITVRSHHDIYQL